MEDKQVTQAFQKALAGLSREDQALGILYFTAEMDAWEAMDAGKREYRAFKFPAESDMYGLAAREPETRRSFVSPKALAY